MMEVAQLIVGCLCAYAAGRAIQEESYGLAGVNTFLALVNGLGVYL